MRIRKKEEGGIMLEAALIVPVILLLTAYLLAQIRSVRYETLVAYALDQTAEEIALLIPLGDALLKGVGAADIFDAVSAWIPGEVLSDQLMTMAADVSSSVVFGRFVHSRVNYWLDEATSSTSVRFPPFEKQLGLFWLDEAGVLRLSLRYDLKNAFFTKRAEVKSIVPLWTEGKAARSETEEDKGEDTYDSIWSLSNFDRGARFRELYGANLPFNFPVIAALKDGEAVSIKSMDLTAPSYSTTLTATHQIEQHAISLSRFDGMSWGEKTILPGEITSRRLKLIVPENAPAYATADYFRELERSARLHGVILEVIKHGKSGRYQEDG